MDEETYIKFIPRITMYDHLEADDCDSISGYTMDIDRIEENENEDIISEENVGYITGLFLIDDISYNPEIYAALDNTNAAYEEMAQCLQNLEENHDQCLMSNTGYVLINHIHFNSKYERSSVEQSAIKTLVCKLGNATHGVIVWPAKEIHSEKNGMKEINYDYSHDAVAYMQKIFMDVGFEPITGTNFFAVWSALKNKKIDKIPLLSQFKDTGKRFKISKKTKIYVPEIPKLDPTNTVMFKDFSDDIVYKIAKKLDISPESVIRNFLTDEINQNSDLIKYAESVGINPIDIIRRNAALENGKKELEN